MVRIPEMRISGASPCWVISVGIRTLLMELTHGVFDHVARETELRELRTMACALLGQHLMRCRAERR